MYALTTLNATNINVTLQETGPDWATVVLTITTIVLAGITFFYMVETRNIRKAYQRPSFAVEPAHFLSGLGESAPHEFLKMNLVNHGQTATDITAQCGWVESPEMGGSGRTFYIMSLAQNGYAGLDVPVKEIVQKNLLLTIKIKCKDASGSDYQTTITNGFDKIKGTSTKIAYQNNYWLTIYGALDNIKNQLDQIKTKIK